MNITFIQDRNWAVESPVELVEGSSLTFNCEFWGVPSSVSEKAYMNGQDKSATILSGAGSTTGTRYTTRTLSSLKGPNRYVVAVTATVDGDTVVRKFECIVAKDEAEA